MLVLLCPLEPRPFPDCQGSAPQLQAGAAGECGHFPGNNSRQNIGLFTWTHDPCAVCPRDPAPLRGAHPVPWGLGCALPLLWAHCHFFLVTALSHICYYWMQPSTDQFTTFPHFSSSVEPNLYLVNTVTSIEFFIQTALARLWAGGQKKANPSALSTEARSPREGRRPSMCSLGFPPPLILGSPYLERFSRDLWDAISRHSDRRLYPRVGVMCLHIGSPLSSAKMIQLVQTPSFCWVLFT